MNYAIVYNDENGNLCVVYPAPEFDNQKSIKTLAKKDVPNGLPYKIIDVESLPSREFRDKWHVRSDLLDNSIGNVSIDFSEVND